MKKGRKYIEPVMGKGDKRKNEAAAEIKNMQAKDIKKGTPKLGVSGKTWDGVSRPSNDLYREEFNRIFGVNNDE